MKKKILFIAVVLFVVSLFSFAKKTSAYNCPGASACTLKDKGSHESVPVKTGQEPGVDISPMKFILFNI